MASPATHTPNMMTSDAQDIGNLTQTTHLTNSPLMSLPREIREGIYAYLLRAGDLAILRTSKQLSHKAKERLYQEGVWRWKFEHNRFLVVVPQDFFVLPPELGKRIQNRDIYVCFGPGSYLDIRYTFKLFANYTEANECYVTFEYNAFDPQSAERLWKNSLSGLAAGITYLTTFKRVVVVLVPTIFKCLPQDLLVDHAKRAEIWRVLKEKLEPSLGPWKVIGGTDEVDGLDGEFVFHPVEFRKFRVRG